MTTNDEPVLAAQRRHESPDLGGAAARMMRALVVRAGEGDTEALEQLEALEALAGHAVQLAGSELYTWGYSYGELAAVVGTSRQAAVKRFGRMPQPLALNWRHKVQSSPATLRVLLTWRGVDVAVGA